jgi:hypothetical protein
MKLQRLMLAAAASCACLAGALQTVLAAGPVNLLVNPGFEDDLDGWTRHPEGTSQIVHDTALAHSGKGCGRATNRTQTWHAPRQDVTEVVKANGKGKYFLSSWLRLASGSAQYNETIVMLKYGGQKHWFDMHGDWKYVTSTEWLKVYGTADLQWAGDLEEAVFYTQVSDPTVDFYTDDCVLAKGGEPSDVVDVSPSHPANVLRVLNSEPKGAVPVYSLLGQRIGCLTLSSASGNTRAPMLIVAPSGRQGGKVERWSGGVLE